MKMMSGVRGQQRNRPSSVSSPHYSHAKSKLNKAQNEELHRNIFDFTHDDSLDIDDDSPYYDDSHLKTMSGLPISVREKLEGRYTSPPRPTGEGVRNANYSFTYGVSKEDEELLRAEFPLSAVRVGSSQKVRSPPNPLSERLKEMKSKLSGVLVLNTTEKESQPEDPLLSQWMLDEEYFEESKNLLHTTKHLLNKAGLVKSPDDQGLAAYFEALRKMDEGKEEGQEEDFPGSSAFLVQNSSEVGKKSGGEKRNNKSSILSSRGKKDKKSVRVIEPENEYSSKKRALMKAALEAHDPSVPTYEVLSDINEELLKEEKRSSETSRANIMDILYAALTSESGSVSIKSPSTSLHLPESHLSAYKQMTNNAKENKGVTKEKGKGFSQVESEPSVEVVNNTPSKLERRERGGLRILESYDLSKVRMQIPPPLKSTAPLLTNPLPSTAPTFSSLYVEPKTSPSPSLTLSNFSKIGENVDPSPDAKFRNLSQSNSFRARNLRPSNPAKTGQYNFNHSDGARVGNLRQSDGAKVGQYNFKNSDGAKVGNLRQSDGAKAGQFNLNQSDGVKAGVLRQSNGGKIDISNLNQSNGAKVENFNLSQSNGAKGEYFNLKVENLGQEERSESLENMRKGKVGRNKSRGKNSTKRSEKKRKNSKKIGGVVVKN